MIYSPQNQQRQIPQNQWYQRYQQEYEEEDQPKYKSNHEMFSEEEEDKVDEGGETKIEKKSEMGTDRMDEIDASALSPIMVLMSPFKPSPQLQGREDFESMEDLNRSGNRLDDNADELTEFEREWHYHPQPQSQPHFEHDMRVNRIFRTRNADFFNPDAEVFHHGERPRQHPVQKNPIK